MVSTLEQIQNTKELMHCYCGTNNRAPRWTFTDPCKPDVRPGAREESASPAWLAAPAMNARDTTKVYIWRLDTGCGPTLYRKCYSHKSTHPEKGIIKHFPFQQHQDECIGNIICFINSGHCIAARSIVRTRCCVWGDCRDMWGHVWRLFVWLWSGLWKGWEPRTVGLLSQLL